MNEPILSVKNLTVCLKNNFTQILSDISFDIYPNDVLAFTGYNGAGKSTLLKVLAGNQSDYIITEGEILFEDKNIIKVSEKDFQEVRKKISFIKQQDDFDCGNVYTIGMLVQDRLSAIGLKISDSEIQSKFEQFFSYAGKNSVTLKTNPNKLSGGQKRILSIFLGIIAKPHASLYLIDEPLNNLDFQNARNVSNIINQIHLDNPESGIVMVTHCRIITCINRAIELETGKIVNPEAKYECHNCYGIANDCGMYEDCVN